MESALVFIVLGVLPLLVSLIGVIGNLVTLVSTYYARKKRRYGFHENWYTATIYIQNLALIDFLYCLIMLIRWFYFILLQIRQHYNDTKGHHEAYKKDTILCNIFNHLGIFLGTCDNYAIVLIALTRAVAITNNRRWENICDRKRNVAIFVVFPWIWSFVFRSLWSQELHSRNADTGFCSPEEITSIIVFRYIFHFPLESVIIFSSYLYIFFYVTRTSEAFNQNETVFSGENVSLIRSRNIRLAKTMAMIAFSSILLGLPMFVTLLLAEMNMIDKHGHSLWLIITYNVLIIQFSNNLFIYVWRKDEHMCAIMDILSMIFPKCITTEQKIGIDERKNASKKVNLSSCEDPMSPNESTPLMENL